MSLPWADQPYALIPTLAFSQNDSHSAYYVATQMALVHNGIIRGLNSVYLQATSIPTSDRTTVNDFLTYCQCWCEAMDHHHDAEEELFFPEIETLTGVTGLMARNVEQHRAFTPGLGAFREYVSRCKAADYSGQKLQQLIEGFAKPLTKHLYEEIDTLRALDIYDGKKLRDAHQRFMKRSAESDKYRVAPLFFGTSDRNFEGGVHNFPAVPFFVPYIVHYLFGRKHAGAWRFNPCNAWSDRQKLAFPPAGPFVNEQDG